MKVRTVPYNQKHQSSYNPSTNIKNEKMRKYYQAALALTAAVSLVALLFYRHEYNKLRFVLQVFNYFGTPQKNSLNCTNNIQVTNTYHQAASTSWQRLSEDFYIYSAYSYDEGEIKGIGFGKHSSNNYYCRVLFDDQLEYVEGKFVVQKIDENRQDLNNDDLINNDDDQEYSGYLFTCKYEKLHDKDVVGMQVVDDKLKNYDSIPIIQVQTLYNNFNSNKTGTIICVAPPESKPLKHIDMISFLAFHDYVGWDNFIVYDYGIPFVFNEAVKKMSLFSNVQWNFTYSAVPWNFPYAQIPRRVIRNLIEADCLYRTFSRASFAVTLAWDEYVNLKYHTSVEHVLSDLNKVNGKIDDKFRLNAVVFCTDYADSDSVNSPTPVILRTTRRLRNVDKDEPLFIYKRDHISSNDITQQEMDELMIINRYKKCNTNDRRQIVNGVLRFAESMPSTQIFQYYITGRLFSHN
ncbi:uncharacterized protein LOC123259394 [Cotesia glomerata]|uniref:uncharacterized protein LOC123259394 n=1 Tax=Cotesia glomerata TaxID=32391 RepID=UPI001D00D106|nr:uncharacterized protein LOC123259394 [Cotesia glomerata]XP_044575818.1 uncharacterized protein LOC123259394 [Cotesia glomerata]XP_044575819.1 uncharacterized protein LOC123259394 [Cotesia glomerata]